MFTVARSNVDRSLVIDLSLFLLFFHLRDFLISFFFSLSPDTCHTNGHTDIHDANVDRYACYLGHRMCVCMCVEDKMNRRVFIIRRQM